MDLTRSQLGQHTEFQALKQFGLLGVCWLVLTSSWLIPGILPALAEESMVSATPPTRTVPQVKTSDVFWDRLDQLRQDKQLQRLVQEDLEKSVAIREQIQLEVDRAFEHTTALLNTLLAVLTSLPVLATIGVWFMRRSVINQIVAETKQQLKAEVESQLETEVANEFKQQAAAFKQQIEDLKTEFNRQLTQLRGLYRDAQQEKDQLIQQLSQITPSSVRDLTTPELQQRIHNLTEQLEQLMAEHAELSFSANDFIEQGRALYFEGRHENALTYHDKALALEPENAKAWFSKGAALTKLQRYDEALVAYTKAMELRPDSPEACFGRGTVLAKLKQYEDAIAAYRQAATLKPDFYAAWLGLARCGAQQADLAQVLESLAQAIRLNPEKSREAIKSDVAFDQIRDRPELQELMATATT